MSEFPKTFTPDDLFKDQEADGEYGVPTPEGYRIRRFSKGRMVSEQVIPIPGAREFFGSEESEL